MLFLGGTKTVFTDWCKLEVGSEDSRVDNAPR
jgi:hypothetical protein